MGTITDDDPALSVSISDQTNTEGAAGTTSAVFTVNLSAASGRIVEVHYETNDGTATSPADYSARTSTLLIFAPGETSKAGHRPGQRRHARRARRDLQRRSLLASQFLIADNQGVGTIVNDDGVIDASGGVSVSGPTKRGAGSKDYTIKVTNQGTGPLTLNLGSAISGSVRVGGVATGTVTGPTGTSTIGPDRSTRYKHDLGLMAN